MSYRCLFSQRLHIRHKCSPSSSFWPKASTDFGSLFSPIRLHPPLGGVVVSSGSSWSLVVRIARFQQPLSFSTPFSVIPRRPIDFTPRPSNSTRFPYGYFKNGSRSKAHDERRAFTRRGSNTIWNLLRLAQHTNFQVSFSSSRFLCSRRLDFPLFLRFVVQRTQPIVKISTTVQIIRVRPKPTRGGWR